MSNRQRSAEKVFVVLALLVYSGAIAPFFDREDIIVNLFPIPAFSITLFLLVARWKRTLSIVVRESFLWVLMAISIASPLWSDWPDATLEKAMQLLRVTVFGIYFSTSYSLRQQLRILTWTCGIAALLSLIACVVLPSRGVMGVGYISSMEDFVHIGKWRGIFIHKSELGMFMSLTALLSFFSAISAHRYRWIFWGIFYLAIGLILKADAKGPFLTLLVLLVLIQLYRALRLKPTILVPFLIILLLIIGGTSILLITNTETILNSLGREITFSGRTEFWPLLVDKVFHRPWLGYGYQAFWEGQWKGEPADIWKYLRHGFQPPHAHNGPLEILLSFGLLGFSVFACSYIAVCARAIAWVRLIPTVEGIIPLTYFTYTMLINLNESYLMRADIYWILYVSFTLSMFSKHINIIEAEEFWRHRDSKGRILTSQCS